MNIIFSPGDGTDQRWPGFKPGRLMSTEAEAIEKVTGLTFAQWGQSLMNGSAVAGRALIWVLRKRDLPALRFRDVDFPVESLIVALDEEERSLVLEAIENDTTLSDEDREAARTAVQVSAEADGEPVPTEPDVLVGRGNGSAPVVSATG